MPVSMKFEKEKYFRHLSESISGALKVNRKKIKVFISFADVFNSKTVSAEGQTIRKGGTQSFRPKFAISGNGSGAARLSEKPEPALPYRKRVFNGLILVITVSLQAMSGGKALINVLVKIELRELLKGGILQ